MPSLRFASTGLAILLLAACASPGATTQRGASAPGVTAGSIKVGFMTDLTGGSSFGTELNYGVTLAVNEINGHGGINGRKLDAVTEDSARTPDGGVLAMRKLLQEDGVFAVEAGANSVAVIPALPLAESARVPVVVTAAADNKIIDPFNKYVYLCSLASGALAQIYGNYFTKTLRPASVSLIVEDLAFSNDIRDRLKTMLPAAGVKIGTVQQVTSTQTSYLPQAQALAQANSPTVLMLTSAPRPAAEMVIQMHRLSYRPQIILDRGASTGYFKLGGAELEGTQIAWAASTQYVGDTAGDMGKWKAAMKAASPAMTDTAFSTGSVIGYTQTYTVAEAIRRAGVNPTRQGMLDALDSMKNFVPGKDANFKYAFPIGLPITFSKTNHQGGSTLALMTIKGGDLVPTGTYLYGAPPAVSASPA